MGRASAREAQPFLLIEGPRACLWWFGLALCAPRAAASPRHTRRRLRSRLLLGADPGHRPVIRAAHLDGWVVLELSDNTLFLFDNRLSHPRALVRCAWDTRLPLTCTGECGLPILGCLRGALPPAYGLQDLVVAAGAGGSSGLLGATPFLAMFGVLGFAAFNMRRGKGGIFGDLNMDDLVDPREAEEEEALAGAYGNHPGRALGRMRQHQGTWGWAGGCPAQACLIGLSHCSPCHGRAEGASWGDRPGGPRVPCAWDDASRGPPSTWPPGLGRGGGRGGGGRRRGVPGTCGPAA